MLLHFWLLQTLLYCAMQFLHLKSCSQDLCPCCCCGRRIYEMSLYAFHFSDVVLHSWDPSFRATSFKIKRVLARIQPPGSYCSCLHVCHRTLTKSQSRRVFHCSIRVLSTLFASYFWFLIVIHSVTLEVPTVLFFHETAPLKVIQSRNHNFYFHWKPRYKTKTRKPGTDIGKHGYSVPDNGGHFVREERRFYRTNQISVGFDRRTDILREVCSLVILHRQQNAPLKWTFLMKYCKFSSVPIFVKLRKKTIHKFVIWRSAGCQFVTKDLFIQGFGALDGVHCQDYSGSDYWTADPRPIGS